MPFDEDGDEWAESATFPIISPVVFARSLDGIAQCVPRFPIRYCH